MKVLLSVFQHLIIGETIQHILSNNNGTAVHLNYFKQAHRQNMGKTVLAKVADSGCSPVLLPI
jgi:hypothetical protein